MIYRSNAIKILSDVFVNTNKLVLKFIGKRKEPSTVKIIWEKKNKDEALTLPDFKTYNKAVIIKAVRYWRKNI